MSGLDVLAGPSGLLAWSTPQAALRREATEERPGQSRPSSEAKGFEVNPKDLGGKSFAFSWSTSAGRRREATEERPGQRPFAVAFGWAGPKALHPDPQAKGKSEGFRV